MFAKSKLSTICYFVSDIERSKAFYKDVLGLSVESMGDDGHGHDWFMATTSNEIELIFFQQESKPGNSPIAVFDVAEGGIDDVVTALSEQGVTIVTPVSHAPGGWSAEFADPDGHVLSMYQSEDLPRTLKSG